VATIRQRLIDLRDSGILDQWAVKLTKSFEWIKVPMQWVAERIPNIAAAAVQLGIDASEAFGKWYEKLAGNKGIEGVLDRILKFVEKMIPSLLRGAQAYLSVVQVALLGIVTIGQTVLSILGGLSGLGEKYGVFPAGTGKNIQQGLTSIADIKSKYLEGENGKPSYFERGANYVGKMAEGAEKAARFDANGNPTATASQYWQAMGGPADVIAAFNAGGSGGWSKQATALGAAGSYSPNMSGMGTPTDEVEGDLQDLQTGQDENTGAVQEGNQILRDIRDTVYAQSAGSSRFVPASNSFMPMRGGRGVDPRAGLFSWEPRGHYGGGQYVDYAAQEGLEVGGEASGDAGSPVGWKAKVLRWIADKGVPGIGKEIGEHPVGAAAIWFALKDWMPHIIGAVATGLMVRWGIRSGNGAPSLASRAWGGLRGLLADESSGGQAGARVIGGLARAGNWVGERAGIAWRIGQSGRAELGDFALRMGPTAAEGMSRAGYGMMRTFIRGGAQPVEGALLAGLGRAAAPAAAGISAGLGVLLDWAHTPSAYTHGMNYGMSGNTSRTAWTYDPLNPQSSISKMHGIEYMAGVRGQLSEQAISSVHQSWADRAYAKKLASDPNLLNRDPYTIDWARLSSDAPGAFLHAKLLATNALQNQVNARDRAQAAWNASHIRPGQLHYGASGKFDEPGQVPGGPVFGAMTLEPDWVMDARDAKQNAELYSFLHSGGQSSYNPATGEWTKVGGKGKVIPGVGQFVGGKGKTPPLKETLNIVATVKPSKEFQTTLETKWGDQANKDAKSLYR
jgi:hypothetical protein